MSLDAREDGVVFRDGRPLQPNDVAAALLRRASPFQEQTLYIVASPLSGRGIRELQQHLDRRSALVLVELDRDVAEATRAIRAGRSHALPVYFERSTALAAMRREIERRGIRRVRQLSASRAAAGQAARTAS